MNTETTAPSQPPASTPQNVNALDTAPIKIYLSTGPKYYGGPHLVHTHMRTLAVGGHPLVVCHELGTAGGLIRFINRQGERLYFYLLRPNITSIGTLSHADQFADVGNSSGCVDIGTVVLLEPAKYLLANLDIHSMYAAGEIEEHEARQTRECDDWTSIINPQGNNVGLKSLPLELVPQGLPVFALSFAADSALIHKGRVARRAVSRRQLGHPRPEHRSSPSELLVCELNIFPAGEHESKNVEVLKKNEEGVEVLGPGREQDYQGLWVYTTTKYSNVGYSDLVPPTEHDPQVLGFIVHVDTQGKTVVIQSFETLLTGIHRYLMTS